MKLLSVEPTPSPNSMKLNIDEKLPPGRRYTYTLEQQQQAPEPLRALLGIEGVRSVFRTADFIALDRKPNADWQRILDAVRRLLQGTAAEGAGAASSGAAAPEEASAYGEVHVFVQMYRGIPMQLRVRAGEHEVRTALPEPFTAAVHEAAGAGMIRERKLEELGVRYGEPEEIAAEVAAELAAAYPAARLRELVAAAQALGPQAPAGEAAALPPRPAPPSSAELAQLLGAADWRERYAALERAKPEPALLPLLAQALGDDNASVRRLAVVYLGDLRQPEALPHLFAALQDRSPAVRRTAGDTLSDLGDPAAIGPMIAALRDANKLVRWRAARFLYEAGDDSALDALRDAADDAEFEVRLQAQMAVARIERGEQAAGSVWQQMTALRQGDGSSFS